MYKVDGAKEDSMPPPIYKNNKIKYIYNKTIVKKCKASLTKIGPT